MTKLTFLTPDEQHRLDLLRANSKKWIRKDREARHWDTPFLLKIIDTLTGASCK